MTKRAGHRPRMQGDARKLGRGKITWKNSHNFWHYSPNFWANKLTSKCHRKNSQDLQHPRDLRCHNPDRPLTQGRHPAPHQEEQCQHQVYQKRQTHPGKWIGPLQRHHHLHHQNQRRKTYTKCRMRTPNLSRIPTTITLRYPGRWSKWKKPR